jgi:hypothetical protein
MPKQHECISEVIVGATPSATISFTSIPSTYTDLKLVISARTNRASDGDYIYLSLNGSQADSGKYMKGYGTTEDSGTVSDNYITIPSTNNTASTFSNYQIYIPNYTNTTTKSISSLGTLENMNATSNALSFGAFIWSSTSASTSAVSSITLTGRFGSFVQYSRATLYGISKS